jgi:hypothetical protein
MLLIVTRALRFTSTSVSDIDYWVLSTLYGMRTYNTTPLLAARAAESR